MKTDKYKVLKRISGENIICELARNGGGNYEISRPLLMHVRPSITMSGMTESLMLSRWVQPFTEQKSFEINPKHVIIMLPASPGLSVYYEGVLNKLEEGGEEIAVTKIDEEEVYEELLEELETESSSIH